MKIVIVETDRMYQVKVIDDHGLTVRKLNSGDLQRARRAAAAWATAYGDCTIVGILWRPGACGCYEHHSPDQRRKCTTRVQTDYGASSPLANCSDASASAKCDCGRFRVVLQREMKEDPSVLGLVVHQLAPPLSR